MAWRMLSILSLSGLCACAQAITTAAPAGGAGSATVSTVATVATVAAVGTVAATAPVVSVMPSLLLAQAAAVAPSSGALAMPPADAESNPSITTPAAAATAVIAAPGDAVTRMALLLPAHSSLFGAAADAVRTGFLTAHERDKKGVEINLVESGDTPADMLRAYIAALATNDIIVGPLSRAGAAAIAQSGRVDKPTVALTQPEGEDAALPPNMLVVALAVEEEARQVANWVEIDKTGGRMFAISTATAWQRRAVKAFLAQSKALGMDAVSLELSAGSGGSVLSASGLAQLKQRIDNDRPALLFIALDAQQGKQLRSAVGEEIPLYGISQLNPRSLSAAIDVSAAAATAAVPPMLQPELNGVKLIDIPWQLSLNSPAVALYPRPLVDDPLKHNADLDRLYALGIDAYRVALEIGRGRRGFDIDGVTGKLSIGIEASASRFQRTETRAIYRDGTVVPIADQP